MVWLDRPATLTLPEQHGLVLLFDCVQFILQGIACLLQGLFQLLSLNTFILIVGLPS